MELGTGWFLPVSRAPCDAGAYKLQQLRHSNILPFQQ
ncbi:hypothetical protein VD0004_g444 [Verticillium dahliae]|nr:hypothetical protein VD0004_g444 [Verticillium dahliae]PNH77063.1 hypothetical protein VD0001_g470 [Verticillium dahliae]